MVVKPMVMETMVVTMTTTPTLVGTELLLGDSGLEVQQAEISKGQVVVIIDKPATLIQLADS